MSELYFPLILVVQHAVPLSTVPGQCGAAGRYCIPGRLPAASVGVSSVCCHRPAPGRHVLLHLHAGLLLQVLV